MKEDALQVVKLRNDFYRDNYRKVVAALLLSFFIVLTLAGALFYIVTHPPAPRYFATSNDGRLVPLIPFDRPNLTNSTVLEWSNTAATAAYSYNFVNYREALQQAADYFTPEGRQMFFNAVKSSNNLQAVIAKKLIVSAVATGVPVVLEQGVMLGRYTWKVQIPMLITFQSASQFSQQSVTVTMLIVRVSPLTSPRGIGIAQFIVSGGGGITG
ncbi:type IVB secretion system apparatus protein IcmL/DotI [Rickettsiella endosymbiont of Dermanyssus gallinae]|uniref:type IVB secretion system apparatus protein IcmL/DotI n=1 Tax=Rickettsiella endosymbiont of Dermanyssus gallinae TaxID=2856608 RepID=UPI001C531E13|nr:type IVB secretion system apparatus protein IcmL/DotI [Rickettsiella endosymbiont of Dermanyssus gallinae]